MKNKIKYAVIIFIIGGIIMYTRVNWQNAPSTATPVNAENLNIMDKGIADAHSQLAENTQQINALDTNKAGKDEVNALATTKAEKTELEQTKNSVNATNLRIDNLVIPISVENANIEVTDAHNSITKNKNFDSLKDRFEDIEKDYVDVKDFLSITRNGTDFAFVLGSFNVNLGVPATADNRIRTTDFIWVGEQGCEISVTTTDVKFNVWLYSTEKTYISNTGWNTTKYKVPKNHYIHITMAKTDDTTITDIAGLASSLILSVFELKPIYFADKSIPSSKIMDKTLGIEKVSFLKSKTKEAVKLQDYGCSADSSISKMLVFYAPGAITYKIIVEPYEKIKIKATNHNRFYIGATEQHDAIPTETKSIPLVLLLRDDTKSEYIYENDGTKKRLFIYLKNPSGTGEPILNVESNLLELNGYVLETKTSNTNIISRNPIKDITSEIYPVLFGVKMSNSNDFTKSFVDVPRPIGWLYYHPVTYELLYASGSPENMKKLCDWNFNVTWNGTSTPAQYRPIITKKGDIVFIWRGDLLGQGTEINPNARQNPIIYPANDYDNPIEVDLGIGIKPTSWLQSCGADYLYNQEILIFAEYTRPPHGECHIWKVVEPITDPSNWRITKTFLLSGHNILGMKHFHLVQYDTFSGVILAATGDDETGAKILMSTDYGETWTVEIEGDPSLARTCNFLFTKDYVYWASDDYDHWLIRASRGTNNVPDFTTVTKIYDLRPHPPTYVSCLVDEPYGILLLNRHDWKDITTDLPVLFWDITTETMHEIAVVHPTPDIIREDGSIGAYGFRVEAANIYQSRGAKGHVVGFANPPNGISVLNNGFGSNAVKLNNLCLEVVKNGMDYDLKFTAFQDRS